EADRVTREELGEFLIARYGAEKLNLLVNKRILLAACRERGVSCPEAELDEEVQKHLRRLNVDKDHFAKEVLKAQRLTFYEWREDVMRTKVLLDRLTRGRVKVTDDDLKQAYDSYYGEKVKCRIILWPKGQERAAFLAYSRLASNEEEFRQLAKTQASPTL